jgi:hypothetical protein
MRSRQTLGQDGKRECGRLVSKAKDHPKAVSVNAMVFLLG